MVSKDKNGYKRGKIEHSDLIHRQIAYKYIYLPNREKYPLPFSKYVIHHKDGNKLNNHSSNLEILEKEEHNRIHGREDMSFSGLISEILGTKDHERINIFKRIKKIWNR